MNILAPVNEFLGRNHYIFLAISIIYIVTALFLLVKFKPSLKKVLIVVFIIKVLSEFIKISEYITPYYNLDNVLEGYYFDKTGLPFHLCSIQIILLCLALICKEGSFKNKLLAFMYPTCFFGAFLSIMMVTVNVEFTDPLTWQYFISHSTLVIFGLYIPLSRQVEINTKIYFNSTVVLLALFVISLYVNGIVTNPSQDVIVNGEVVGQTGGIFTNYFYSLKPPLSNLPLLNLKHGWLAYVLVLAVIGVVSMTLMHLPFIIKDIKNKKNNKTSSN